MGFRELLERLHDTQKLTWVGAGDITGKEYTVRELKQWNDQGEFALVSGDFTLTLNDIEIYIIKHDYIFNLPNYPHKVKADIVLFRGTLEFI